MEILIMKNIELIKRKLVTAGFAKLSIKKVLDAERAAFATCPSEELFNKMKALEEIEMSWFYACDTENKALLALQEATSLTEACDFYNENVVKYFL